MLPTGTRIRFTKELTDSACEDHPNLLYARAGELGEITGHGCREGYWVKTDNWPTPFGAAPHEFEVMTPDEPESRLSRAVKAARGGDAPTQFKGYA